MTAIEVALLLIGVVFILGSFFITEKLTATELSRVADLSEEELRIVMDRELQTAGAKISDMADQAVDLSVNQIQRKMEKDTNEKMMAISEYSDSVMDKLQKFNNEVTFLYSMLGDKHMELNEHMAQLNDLIGACKAVQEQTTEVQSQYLELKNSSRQDADPVESETFSEESPKTSQEEIIQIRSGSDVAEISEEGSGINTREEILRRYRDGEEQMDIARDMGLGYGEVKLIVELYKGEENL